MICYILLLHNHIVVLLSIYIYNDAHRVYQSHHYATLLAEWRRRCVLCLVKTQMILKSPYLAGMIFKCTNVELLQL